MTTAAATLRPACAAFAPRVSAVTHPATLRQRGQRFAAATLLLAAVSIPVTGAGSALGATHAPAQVTVAAVADAVVGVVATGKNDV